MRAFRTNQVLTDTDLTGLETTLVQVGEGRWRGASSRTPRTNGGTFSLVYFVRGLVCLPDGCSGGVRPSGDYQRHPAAV